MGLGRGCHVRRLSAVADAARHSTVAAPRAGRVPGMARTIATNTTVDLDGLLEFVRPRHHMVLMTTRGRRPPPGLAGDRRGRRRRGGSSSRPTATAPRRPTPARDPRVSVAGALRRLRWGVGAGRRGLRGDRRPRLGRAARGVLPLHLGGAPRLGRVPPGDGRAGQVDPADHPDPLGPGRHRRLPRPPRRPARTDARR